ncbi:MAG: regulatory protein RecX [Coriobacteriia bacterium]|nr:regulatory protein RecX [Coriobacteriia bacterium]
MGEKQCPEITIACPYGAARRVRSILIEDVEVRRTSAEALRIAHIKSGDVLTAGEIHRLLDESEPEAAMNRSLRLLGHRERSRMELDARLDEDGYPASVAADVLDRLTGYGYLDDGRFAMDLVRTKYAAGWGRRRIERALADKGVDPAACGAILDEYVPLEDEDLRAVNLIARLDLTTSAAQAKALRKLVSKGFSYDVARSAVQQVSSQRLQEEEEYDC